MFSDLECDYINPIDLCSQLNRVRVLRSSHSIRANLHVLSLVCPARIRSACLPRFVFPALGSMVGAHAKSTASSIQCSKVRLSPSPPTPLYSSHLRPFLPINIIDLVSVHRVMSQGHIYDATEIFRTLPQHKKESFIKLGFYLISFFYYLYRYIRALL